VNDLIRFFSYNINKYVISSSFRENCPLRSAIHIRCRSTTLSCFDFGRVKIVGKELLWLC